jgi:hypothetical protein
VPPNNQSHKLAEQNFRLSQIERIEAFVNHHRGASFRGKLAGLMSLGMNSLSEYALFSECVTIS